MPILNYTTSVSVMRTVAEVQKILVGAGARSIAAEYDEAGNVTGLHFTMVTPFGQTGYSLPVHADKVLAVLKREKVRGEYQKPEQAERVAWRILKDWIEAQVALIRTEMVTLDQVMLPYMRTTDGRTVYELYIDDQLALGAG